MKQPECLRIPTLYEGETAEISWALVDQDANYIVERNFNETFSQALSGYTWANIDNASDTWSKYDQDTLNWYQIETRTGKGQSWERLDYEGLSWSKIENQSQTWRELECKAINFEIFRGSGIACIGVDNGRTWYELDKLDESWSSQETTGYSWNECEKMMLSGLSWESIEARWLTFGDWERKGLTFDELETQQGVAEHRRMTDSIPIGAESAMYRLKAYGSDGKESSYLTTDQIPVIPIFYRKSEMNYPVKAGKCYRVLMKAEDVYGLDKVRMNLHYNQFLLELTDFAAYNKKNIIKPGDYPEEGLKIYSHEPGKIWFQSTKSSTQNESYSGAIAIVEFAAKGTGTAAVSLS